MRQAKNNIDKDLMPMPRQDMAAGKRLTKMQRVAEATYGIIAPANGVTLTGIGLTALGCQLFRRGKKLAGVGVAIAGLMCDLADGMVARRTRTGNYLAGRHLDAVTDGVKAGMIAATLQQSGIYTIPEIAVNYSPKLLGWLTNFTSRFILDNDPKTSEEGKNTEFVRWLSPGLAVGSYLLRCYGCDDKAKIVRRAGWAVTGLSFVLGMRSAVGYMRALVSDTTTANQRRRDKITRISDVSSDWL